MLYKNCISCRTVLYCMITWGTGIHYMIRVILNVVIVAIVKPPETPPSERFCQLSLGDSLSNTTSDNTEQTYEFHWNKYEQGLVLGAYYWFHWLSELLGGILTTKFGTKMVFGAGNLSSVILGFILPLVTRYHLYAIIALRILQGIVAGVVFPSGHNMIAKWIPQDERSQFFSAYAGGGIAITITYAISGYIITYLGWEAVFYITSIVGIVWYIFWQYLVFNSPLEHPRISEEEKKYILEHIEHVTQTNLGMKSIPWMDILTSAAVWLAIFASLTCVWGYYTLMIQAPAYFSFIYGWSIEKTGVMAGLPHFLTFIFSLAFGNVCDWLLRKNKLSLINVRKLAVLVSGGGLGLMTLGISFSGCYPSLAFSFMFTGIAIAGAYSSGSFANLADLSPNYASVLLGICGFIVDLAGIISPIVVGLLTYENPSISQWKIIFTISAAIMGIGCLLYLIWAIAEVQPWNTRKAVINNENCRNKEIELATLIEKNFEPFDNKNR